MPNRKNVHPSGAPESRDPRTLQGHPQAERLPGLGQVDYRELVADIAERGITLPLDITSTDIVLDGHQRLRAALELALEQVPVRIVSPPDEFEYMVRTLLRRRNLEQAQKAALALELVDYEALKEQALARRRANLPALADPEVATLPLRGRTREQLADFAGVGARTMHDVITVREVDVELFEQVKAGTKKAHALAGEIYRERRLAKLSHAPPMPEGPFPLIYADPPWSSGSPDAPFAPERHYPTMPLDQIKALPVPAADEAALFLWVINCQLEEGLEVMHAWGFECKGNFVWRKPSPGQGRWIRNQHELLLFGVRGNFPCPLSSSVPASIIDAPRGKHSEKPECVYELIEDMYRDVPKLELFARGKPREGWTAWGNEVQS